jgi:hypothetical protein
MDIAYVTYKDYQEVLCLISDLYLQVEHWKRKLSGWQFFAVVY